MGMLGLVPLTLLRQVWSRRRHGTVLVLGNRPDAGGSRNAMQLLLESVLGHSNV